MSSGMEEKDDPGNLTAGASHKALRKKLERSSLALLIHCLHLTQPLYSSLAVTFVFISARHAFVLSRNALHGSWVCSR